MSRSFWYLVALCTFVWGMVWYDRTHPCECYVCCKEESVYEPVAEPVVTIEVPRQEPFQFGPEDHPGFYDPVPDEDEETELEKAMRYLEAVESGGSSWKVGDRKLTYKAYGVLQIRQPYLSDVNRLFSGQVRKTWGRPLTTADMRDPSKARWTAERYLRYYGALYQSRTGREPTVEVFARIHNGGPDGWLKSSTVQHARKVLKAMEEGA